MRVGQIVGAHGLKGQVKVQSFTDFLDRFSKGSKLRVNDEVMLVETSSIHKGRPLIKFAGVDHIDVAEKLQWAYVEATGVPQLSKDEFLSEDLIGLRVFTQEGELLGLVEQVEAYPAHDVLTVSEIQIPIIREFLDDIDLDERKITVRLIPGMRPGEEGG